MTEVGTSIREEPMSGLVQAALALLASRLRDQGYPEEVVRNTLSKEAGEFRGMSPEMLSARYINSLGAWEFTGPH